MPKYRPIPDDHYLTLEATELREQIVFLPNAVKVTVIHDGARVSSEVLLLGWRDRDGAHVFLSPDGFARTLPGWTVTDHVL